MSTEIYTSEVDLLATDWFRRARESQKAHYACANNFSLWNLWLGVPAIVLSTIVGTAVFASLDAEKLPGWGVIAIGCTSIAAAVLTSLQTFLGYAERADRHRVAGAEYGAIRRSLELLKTKPPENEEDLMGALSSIKETLDLLAKETPEVPAKIREKTDHELKSREHKRVFHVPASRGKKKSSSADGTTEAGG